MRRLGAHELGFRDATPHHIAELVAAFDLPLSLRGVTQGTRQPAVFLLALSDKSLPLGPIKVGKLNLFGLSDETVRVSDVVVAWTHLYICLSLDSAHVAESFANVPLHSVSHVRWCIGLLCVVARKRCESVPTTRRRFDELPWRDLHTMIESRFQLGQSKWLRQGSLLHVVRLGQV